jgi:hypothetical protein
MAVSYGTIDNTARKINKQRCEMMTKDSFSHLAEVKKTYKELDKKSCQVFDMKKLQTMKRLCKNKFEYKYPRISVHKGEDLKMFTRARFEEDTQSDSTILGYLYHDTQDDFKDTCKIIASIHGVNPDLVEVAIWMTEIHVIRAEMNLMVEVDSFYDAFNMFGLTDKSLFKFMCQVYCDCYHCDYARIAQMLDKK